MGEAKRRGSRDERIANLLTASGVVGLTPERYNAFVAWTRSPIAAVVGEELEFFANTDESLLGVLIKDRTDRDFGFVVLGRDAKRRFRCIDMLTSMHRTAARHALFESLKKHSAANVAVYQQGDEDKDPAGVDLFGKRADESRLHPHFRLLRDATHQRPARAMMSEMMHHFVDVDGNFVEQFQTTAFDSRIWELYLYAALLELNFFVSKRHSAPDFELTKAGEKVYIEAAIVGPSPKDPPLNIGVDGQPEMHSAEKIQELLKTRMPIRFGNALYSKLNRKHPYWELDHVSGHSLIFAVADFHEQYSMTWTSPALLEYLYGVTHDFTFEDGRLVITPLQLKTHEYLGKTIPSGFFFLPDAEHVSAVLFSSSGTVSKFGRMGMLAGFGAPGQRMTRVGVRHVHDANAVLPAPFMQEFKQGQVKETWAEGLSLFHNPRALRPVDPNLFPNVAHHFFDDGQIQSLIPEFHPYTATTWNLLEPDFD